MYKAGYLSWSLPESDAETSSDENESAVKNNSPKTLATKIDRNDEIPSVNSDVKMESQPIKTSGSNDSIPGVSPEMWQKFKELQTKNQEMKRTTQRTERRRRRKRHRKADESTSAVTSEEDRKHQAEREAHWNGLTQYFGVNDRFEPPACSRPLPKTGLEKSIDSAIAEGDYGKAEDLSDRLATQELAVKIAGAIDCRDFVKTKQEAEASREAQKRKKQVAWGFEAKKRWETKSNMGYM
ncbi:protein FAM204A isoform X2 [Megalops cyprinoides]|uniref:protein FAM204A isoform X2 n=1 Tax=Megalops cyprinoides TaxID=118141 RepID=UPI0018641C8F|nr:protein FAM204A isoform X2 [Megalops cyprinoides]